MSLLKRLEQVKDTAHKPKGGSGEDLTPFQRLKMKVHEKIVAEIDPDLLNKEDEKLKRDLLKGQVEEFLIVVGSVEKILLPRAEHNLIVKEIVDEILGLGPLEPLIQDVDVSEIMVNGPNQVYVERKGKLTLTDVKFKNDDQVLHVIEKIISPLGRRIDESMPYVDARLKDGSRVNAIIPPLALNGSTITIRKFAADPLTVKDLIGFGSMNDQMAEFLEACVRARFNIVVSGGTGSGKTTLLNVLSSFIGQDERIVTCEDAAEIQLRQPHWVRLETRPPNIEGKGAVTMRDLIKNTLRMRPDRVIVGECRSGETLDMLQAMNTGHDGSLTTLHANTPRDALARIETMVMMAGMALPQRAIREQISSAVHLIVQQSRLQDGSRKIMNITEIQGMEGEIVVLQDIFVFRQDGIDPNTRKVIGKPVPTGMKPKFFKKFEEEGIKLPPAMFIPKD